MSRTYRLRHLPKIGGRKFVDASMRRRYWDIRDLAEKEIDEANPNMWRWSTHRYRLIDSLVAGRLNVVCMTQHPWASWSRIAACKMWYKKFGNRVVRRNNRAVVKNSHLGDEMDNYHRFYDKKDGWDIWSLY